MKHLTLGALAAAAALIAPAAASATTCTLCVTNRTATSLKVSGTAQVQVPDANITVESTGKAADLSSEGSVTAGEIGIAGTWSTSGSAWFSVAPTHTLADDFGSFSAGPSSGAVSTSSSQVRTISPGTYSSLTASGSSMIHLEPGVYVVTGPVTASGGAHIDGSGVTLVLPSGILTVSGPSLVDLDASQVSSDRVVVSGSSILRITGGTFTPPPDTGGGGIV
jgi:hypothetical protein